MTPTTAVAEANKELARCPSPNCGLAAVDATAEIVEVRWPTFTYTTKYPTGRTKYLCPSGHYWHTCATDVTVLVKNVAKDFRRINGVTEGPRA